MFSIPLVVFGVIPDWIRAIVTYLAQNPMDLFFDFSDGFLNVPFNIDVIVPSAVVFISHSVCSIAESSSKRRRASSSFAGRGAPQDSIWRVRFPRVVEPSRGLLLSKSALLHRFSVGKRHLPHQSRSVVVKAANGAPCLSRPFSGSGRFSARPLICGLGAVAD